MKNHVVLFICALFCSIGSIQSQNAPSNNAPSKGYDIGLNSYHSYLMMEPNQNLRKLKVLMESKEKGLIPDRSLTFGFSLIGIADYQKSNIDDKFGYLMRHPTSNNQIGDVVSEAVLHSAQLSMTASINSWITAYGELLYDPQQSFGAGTITTLTRNQVQLRKGFVVLGNTAKFPLYVSIGKMDIPFGQTNSVSPFTNSTMWHAFGGLAYSAIVGFNKYGLNANISLIQGGAQFRAINAPVQGTSVPSRLNNFAADLNYSFSPIQNVEVRIGGSYLKGTAYCQPWPVVHFMPCEETNGAYTFYGSIMINNRLFLKGGFAETEDVWPGTFNPAPPLNEFAASKVSSLDYGAVYRINTTGDILYSLSGEFSNFVAGPEGSPWERQNQIVIGINGEVQQTTRLFVEFVRTEGYVPLNWISGGNFDDPGITHSSNEANTFGFVIGAMVSL